jgi:CBS domain-containing protein
MRTPVFTVNPELRIERAWELMARMGVRHLPVVKNEVLVGIVTERDLKRAVFSQNRAERVSYRESFRATFAPGDVAVEAIMTRSVSVAKPSEPLRLVAVRMLRQRVGALPVVAGNGELLGILTLSDLVRAMLTAYEEQPAATAPTITPSTTPLSQKGASVWVTQ